MTCQNSFLSFSCSEVSLTALNPDKLKGDVPVFTSKPRTCCNFTCLKVQFAVVTTLCLYPG